jgi:hypothetical protein
MKFLLLLLATTSLTGYAQSDVMQPVYYAGFNPVAPFTGIRSNFTSRTLPAASNLESGIAVFIGKIWDKNYNVETRLCYGSPFRNTRQFSVQSGMLYRFNSKHNQRAFPGGIYAGLFLKFEGFSNTEDDLEKNSAVMYWSAGKKFVFGRCIADVRISQQFLGIKWTTENNSKGVMGFHTSNYNWKSPYMPFAAIGLGYILNKNRKT